jgi:hypothetical protein
MDFDFLLDDVVLFELPTFEDVEAFSHHLRSRWPGWSDADEHTWLFTVNLLGGEPDELAQLLRRVQDLLAELGLPAIRFYLDGRVYGLYAAVPSVIPTG